MELFRSLLCQLVSKHAENTQKETREKLLKWQVIRQNFVKENGSWSSLLVIAGITNNFQHHTLFFVTGLLA